MKLKFRTEKACWHNGRYYEADDIVECDCKFCKEGSVPYFKKVDDNNEVVEETKEEVKEEVTENKNVSQETITDEKKEEVKESKPKRKNKIEIV